MGKKDHREFDDEVKEQQLLQASPMQSPIVLLCGLDFVVVPQERDEIGHQEGNVHPKVADLMHKKSTQASNKPFRVGIEKILPRFNYPRRLHAALPTALDAYFLLMQGLRRKTEVLCFGELKIKWNSWNAIREKFAGEAMLRKGGV